MELDSHLSTMELDSALDLLRRLNPKRTAVNLNSLLNLVPHLTEELLSSVDQPLQVRRCKQTERDYLLCDYNRDWDSYRSPWSNEFDPPILEGSPALPSDKVRKIEIAANDAFDVYREMYYEGGVSSVYLWDSDSPDGFAGVVLMKKSVESTGKSEGSWDSIHVFDCNHKQQRLFHYKLTSTVILHMANSSEALGEMDLSGSMTRDSKSDLLVDNDDSHIMNIGKLVEDMEMKIRTLLQEVYFGKAKDVVGDLRVIPPLSEKQKEKSVHAEMLASMSRR